MKWLYYFLLNILYIVILNLIFNQVAKTHPNFMEPLLTMMIYTPIFLVVCALINILVLWKVLKSLKKHWYLSVLHIGILFCFFLIITSYDQMVKYQKATAPIELEPKLIEVKKVMNHLPSNISLNERETNDNLQGKFEYNYDRTIYTFDWEGELTEKEVKQVYHLVPNEIKKGGMHFETSVANPSGGYSEHYIDFLFDKDNNQWKCDDSGILIKDKNTQKCSDFNLEQLFE